MLKLNLPVIEEEYILIGIHTSVEAYKLAYLINKHFNISFKRADFDVDVTYKHSFAHFPLFNYYDQNWDCEIYLIANKFTSELPNLDSSGSLFEASIKATQSFYLFESMKHIDYFIKVEDDLNIFDGQYILNTINNIAQIKKAYRLDQQLIKNPEYLIFK